MQALNEAKPERPSTELRSRHAARVLAALAVLTMLGGPADAEGTYRNRWALLVGVGQFQSHAIPPLQFCDADVEAVRELLTRDFGYDANHISSLTGAAATRGAIVKQLSLLSDRGRVTEEDFVVVYFSGHGQTVALPRGGNMGFLIPYDAQVDLADAGNPSAYYDTCVGMDQLRRLSSLIPARHVLFLVDACYSGLAVQSTRGVPVRAALATVARRPVRQLIVAGLRDEEAVESADWGHGAFTVCLLNGLSKGLSDCNSDGVVTGLELATYLRGAVPELAPSQTPQYATFDGDGEFMFTRPEAAQPVPAAVRGPRIVLVQPSDEVGGEGLGDVCPLGGMVTLTGAVLSPGPVQSVTANGQPTFRLDVSREALGAMVHPQDRTVTGFTCKIEVPGGELEIRLAATMPDGAQVIRRVVLVLRADDKTPPQVAITEVRAYDQTGRELGFRGLTVASKGLTVASKSVTVDPALPQSVTGFVRDDEAVVSVAIAGVPVATRPATGDELAGLGWSSGVAFEGPVPAGAQSGRQVTVTARDAAGNEGSDRVRLEFAPSRGPQIVVLQPRQTRGVRGTGLMVPKAATQVRVTGLARSDPGITGVSVGGSPAALRPATQQELAATTLDPPVIFFEAAVNVPLTSEPYLVEIAATDAARKTAAQTIPLRRPAPPVQPEFASDKMAYRAGERVHFTLASPQDAYVYLFHREATGNLTIFLPNPVEPDTLLVGGEARVFPSPVEEARWQGDYGLMAQEPAGTDTVYLLAITKPLPAETTRAVSSPSDLTRILQALAGLTPRAMQPTLDEDADIAGLAEDLGGTWRRLRYEVRPR